MSYPDADVTADGKDKILERAKLSDFQILFLCYSENLLNDSLFCNIITGYKKFIILIFSVSSQEVEMDNLMKSSGNSSDQLVLLNDQLRTKER